MKQDYVRLVQECLADDDRVSEGDYKLMSSKLSKFAESIVEKNDDLLFERRKGMLSSLSKKASKARILVAYNELRRLSKIDIKNKTDEERWELLQQQVLNIGFLISLSVGALSSGSGLLNKAFTILPK